MTDFEKKVLDLSLHFIRRGYPEDIILDAAILARRLDCDTLLQSVGKKTDKDNKK